MNIKLLDIAIGMASHIAETLEEDSAQQFATQDLEQLLRAIRDDEALKADDAKMKLLGRPQ